AVRDLVPECGLAEAALDDLPQGDRVAQPVDPRPEGDVVEDRLRERVRLLEDHADATAQHHRIDVRTIEVVTVDGDAARDAGAGNAVVHPVETTQEGRLSAAGRADEGRHAGLRDVERDGAEGVDGAVVDVQVADGDLDRRIERGRRGGRGFHGSWRGCHSGRPQDALPSAMPRRNTSRAKTLAPRTSVR